MRSIAPCLARIAVVMDAMKSLAVAMDKALTEELSPSEKEAVS